MTIRDLKNRFRLRKYLLLALLLISASLGYATIINKHATGRAQYNSDNSREIPRLPEGASVLWNLADTSAYLNVNDDSNFGDTDLPILGVDALVSILDDELIISLNDNNHLNTGFLSGSPFGRTLSGSVPTRPGAAPATLFLNPSPGSNSGNGRTPASNNPGNNDSETDITENTPDRQPTANENTKTVPEPITLVLMGLGLAAIALTRRQKRF